MRFMIQERPTFHIDPTPQLPTRLCRFMARLLGYCLSYGNYIIAPILGWMYGWFYGISLFLLGFILFGILRSKLRNDSIPQAQQEFPYDDYAIATWYLDRHHCILPPKES